MYLTSEHAIVPSLKVNKVRTLELLSEKTASIEAFKSAHNFPCVKTKLFLIFKL